MAIFEKEITVNDIISMNDSGVNVASYYEINNFIKTLYKQIYGSDIDLSNPSADGQWAANVALIISNIVNVVQKGINQLNPSEANGRFLDVMASLSNISRIPATKSTAWVYVKNISGSTVSDVTKIVLSDKNAITWTWNAVDDGLAFVDFDADEVKCLRFSCDEYGPIAASGTGVEYDASTSWSQTENGDIYQPVEYGTFQTYQEEDATLGSYVEDDVSLKQRISMSSSPQSSTILSGLRQALMNISGIKDVSIFNNIDTNNIDAGDGTAVPLHNVYCCIRYAEDPDEDDESTVVLDETVGNILYNKMTPGILYTETEDSDFGFSGEYTVPRLSGVTYKVYWKKCRPFVFSTDPDHKEYIILNLNLTSSYSGATTALNTEHVAANNIEENIRDGLIDYLNNVKLDEKVMLTRLLSAANSSDIYVNGLHTFYAITGNIRIGDSNYSVYTLPKTYFHLTDNCVTFNYTSATNCDIRIYTTPFSS